MSRRCPRCGGRVEEGIFAICSKCGAAASSKSWGPADREKPRPTLTGSLFAGSDAASRPNATGTVTRLLGGVIIAIVVGAIGLAVLRATIDGDASSSGATGTTSARPATSAAAGATSTATKAAATQAPATSATVVAVGAVTEDACASLWNAAKNEQARAGLVALGVRHARIRPSSNGCVLVAILPGSPPAATRFTEQEGIYAVAGQASTVPTANARIDTRGRAVLA